MASTRGPGGRPAAGPRTASRSRSARAAATATLPPPSSAPVVAPPLAGPAAPVGHPPSVGMRIAGVTVVLVVLALSYAVPVRSWWYQRGQLAVVEAELAAVETDVTALETEDERWQDPAFIRAQARERLNFVLPGEVGVVVLGLDELLAGEEPAPVSGVVVPARVDDAPWWVGLWDGFEAAGGVGAGPTVPEESLGGVLAEEP